MSALPHLAPLSGTPVQQALFNYIKSLTVPKPSPSGSLLPPAVRVTSEQLKQLSHMVQSASLISNTSVDSTLGLVFQNVQNPEIVKPEEVHLVLFVMLQLFDCAFFPMEHKLSLFDLFVEIATLLPSQTGPICNLIRSLIQKNTYSPLVQEFLVRLLYLAEDPAKPIQVSRQALLIICMLSQSRINKQHIPSLWRCYARSFGYGTIKDVQNLLKFFTRVVKEHGIQKNEAKLIAESILQQLPQKQAQQVIANFNDLFEEQPLIFKGMVHELVLTVKTVFNCPDASQYTKKNIIDGTLPAIVRKFPTHFKSNPSDFLLVLEMVFMSMVSIPYELPDEWLHPIEGKQEVSAEDPANLPIFDGMQIIDQMFQNVDCQSLGNIILQCLVQCKENPDWRYHYASLMVLAQLPQYLKRKSFFTAIYEIVMQNVFDPNPKIRFACYQIIGQAVDDKREIIHQQFFDITIKTILKGLEDPVIRVASHAMACFTNFGEKCEYHLLKPYFPTLLNAATAAIDSKYPFVIQNGLSGLHELFGCLGPSHIKSIDYLHILAKLEALLDAPYALVRLQSLQTGSKLLVQLKKSQADFDFLTHSMFFKSRLMDKLDSANEQQNQYYVNTMRKLYTISKGHVLFSTEDEQSLLKFCKNSITNYSEDEDSVIATLELVKLIIQHSQDPNIESTIQYFIKSQEELIYEKKDTWSRVCELCLTLIERAKKRHPGPVYQQTFYKYFYAMLELVSIDNDIESVKGTPELQLNTIGDILKECSFALKTQAMNKLSKVILHLISEMLNEHQRISQSQEEEELDEETAKQYDLLLDEIQASLQSSLAIIQTVYQKFPESVAGKMLDYLVNNICQKCLASPRFDMMNTGVYIVCDVVNYVNYEKISHMYAELVQIFITHISKPDHGLRQSCSYGLGVVAKKSPDSFLTSGVCDAIRIALTNAAMTPPDEQNQKRFFYAQDNVVAALGHMVHRPCVPQDIRKHCLWTWLQYLPLRGDKEEAKQQHEMLLKLELGEHLSANKELLVLLLKALSKLYQNRKMSNKQMDLRIAHKVKELSSRPDLLHLSDYIWEQLTDVERSKLTEIQLQELHIDTA